MIKLQHLVSRKPMPPFHKQPFVDVLQNRCSKSYAIFTGKHLLWSLFLIEFQSFRPATLLKSNSNKGTLISFFIRNRFTRNSSQIGLLTQETNLLSLNFL